MFPETGELLTMDASSSLAPSPKRSARSEMDWVTDSTLIGSS